MSKYALPIEPVLIRARFIGSLTWTCSKCGCVTKSRISRSTWRIRCNHGKCLKWYAFGMLLHTQDARQDKHDLPLYAPPVTVEPNEPLPRALLHRWQVDEPLSVSVALPPPAADAAPATMLATP